MGSLYDIPAEFDDVKVYNSTLGHKVNNQFGSVANSKFWPLEHPRFGKSKRVNVLNHSQIYVTERSGTRDYLVVYSFPDWNRTTSMP